jgi:MAGUK p55 subfamily protein 5
MTRRITSDKQKKKMHTSVSAEGLNRDVKGFTEGELLQLYHSSQEILAEYGHYLDWVIVNDDLQVATDMLLEVARRIEEEPQWVPAIWVEEV